MKDRIAKIFKSINKALIIIGNILYFIIIIYGIGIIITNDDIKAKIIGGLIVLVILVRLYFKIYS